MNLSKSARARAFCEKNANSELCILHAFFGLEGILIKVRALFVKKCDFFDSKSMLTSLIGLGTFFLTLLKQICAEKIYLQRLKCPRARNKRKYL